MVADSNLVFTDPDFWTTIGTRLLNDPGTPDYIFRVCYFRLFGGLTRDSVVKARKVAVLFFLPQRNTGVVFTEYVE